MNKLSFQTPDEAETVFYEAFMRGDYQVMQALWAEGEVVCVHPGSGVIVGYDAVLRSWEHILGDGATAEIQYTTVKKTQLNDLSVHIVAEEIISMENVVAIVIATNVYHKFEQGWLMIEHHASMIQQESGVETLQ